MPTVIAFRDGTEVDRLTGLQKRDELLEWLGALTHGETSLDLSRASVTSKPEDMQERMAHARKLVDAARLEPFRETEGHVQDEILLQQPAGAAGAGVLTPMAGIDDDGVEAIGSRLRAPRRDGQDERAQRYRDSKLAMLHRRPPGPEGYQRPAGRS